MADLKHAIINVPDFPKPGILFRDISPLLRNHFPQAIAEMVALYTPEEWAGVDVIGGVESRGFILGAGLALATGKGFVKIRKAGKLPGTVLTQHYGLEYGNDALEMQFGTGRMLVVDDVLATGGTLEAAAQLAQRTGYTVTALCCLINLTFLNQFRWQNIVPRCVIAYTA